VVLRFVAGVDAWVSPCQFSRFGIMGGLPVIAQCRPHRSQQRKLLSVARKPSGFKYREQNPLPARSCSSGIVCRHRHRFRVIFCTGLSGRPPDFVLSNHCTWVTPGQCPVSNPITARSLAAPSQENVCSRAYSLSGGRNDGFEPGSQGFGWCRALAVRPGSRGRPTDGRAR